ncbi:hypothetical protein ACFONC_13990 [Luteimonas soli]|uniref:DUF4402 domain-containing protein n=1 Tax=Luteimonas soli TaxID=1648966 RepID=A0ABV7XNF2_9GAMM
MKFRRAIPLALCLALSGMAPATQAFVVNIDGSGLLGGASVYLRVGDGVYSGNFINHGTPGNGGPLNRVSVTVPAAMLGNGSNLAMTSNATEPRSFYDSFVFCNVPQQVYVGGFNRGGLLTGGDTVLTVTAPTHLVSANGDTIPFSQISWTSSGNGDAAGSQPFPAGTFSGGTQSLGSFPKNTWRESCHTFSYGNDAIVPAGTYNGRVTYTLTVP